MTTATRTDEARREKQAMNALARANEKRSKRAALRRSIEAGRTRVAKVILDPPECLTSNRSGHGITLAELLSWQFRWGNTRARKFLRSQGVGGALELQALSESRRRQLAKALRQCV